MIDNNFLQRIGLTAEQITILRDAMNKESRYRRILFQEKISPGVIEPIIKATKLEEIDFSNENLLREKVRTEWKDMMIEPECQK